MVKSAILITLLSGAVFTQMIQASSTSLDEASDNSDEDITDGEDSDTDEGQEENYAARPALICLLFENLGCNIKCSTTASAFSFKGSGQCTEEKTCQCNVEQDESLDSLFRAKFKAAAALKKIKRNKDLSAEVLEILQIPYQTSVQTKRQLQDVVSPAIYKQLAINDKTPAWEMGLIDEANQLDFDKIKTYVSEQLKPVIKLYSKQLKSVNYKSNMEKALKENTDEDLQSIINEVRQTKNKNLNDIVDNFLKSADVDLEVNSKNDDISDAIAYQIIDQFVNHIEQKEKPVAKKPVRRLPKKSRSKPANKIPAKQENLEISNKPSSKENIKNGVGNSSDSRFNLPGFRKDFIRKIGISGSKTFASKDYTLSYDKNDIDNFHFTWSKGGDEVRMNILPDGSISQSWRLDSAIISLNRSSDGSIAQSWDFVKTKYAYSRSSLGTQCGIWTDGKKDLKSLKKYQSLVNEWCDKNDFLFSDKNQCIIY